MIKFIYKHNSQEILTVENASTLFKKDVFRKFEEAITQQFKHTLLHQLAGLRDELEKENMIVECNYNKATENFDFRFTVQSEELNEKLGKMLEDE